MVVAAHLRAAEPGLHLALRGQEEHGQGGVALVLAEVADEVVAADVGEEDVHEHEVGPELAERGLEALGIRAHRDLVPARLEDRLQVRGLLGVVLHGEDPRGMGLVRVQEVLQAAHERLPVHRLLEIAVRAPVDGLDLVHEPAARAQDEDGHRFAAGQRAELVDHVVAGAVASAASTMSASGRAWPRAWAASACVASGRAA